MRFWTVCAGVVVLSASLRPVMQLTVLSREFVYETAPFPSAHASTIVETNDGLVAAWFGGTAEKNPDVGIWVSRRSKGAWSAPMRWRTAFSPMASLPTWNPVLFLVPNGPLALFYKVGPSPSEWWGMVTASDDVAAGLQPRMTWQTPRRLPEGILGPIRAKPVCSIRVLSSPGPALKTRAGACTWNFCDRARSATNDELRQQARDERRMAGESDDGGGVDENAAAELAGRVRRDSADGSRALAQAAPDSVPHRATGDRRIVVERRRRHVECHEGHALPNPSAGIDVVKLSEWPLRARLQSVRRQPPHDRAVDFDLMASHGPRR